MNTANATELARRQESLRRGGNFLSLSCNAVTTQRGHMTTVRAYCRYAVYCWKGTPPWPASQAMVEGFLVHTLRRGLTVKAARNYITGIMWFMRVNDIPHTPLREHPHLQRMLAGAQRQFGAVERSARPITKQFLLMSYDKYVLPYYRKAAREVPGLLGHLENQHPVALRNQSAVAFMNVWSAWTATLVGYYACMRLDNLLPATLTNPSNSASFLKRGNMWVENDELWFEAERSKTNQYGTRTHTAAITAVGGPMCAVAAMESHSRYTYGKEHKTRGKEESLFRLRTAGRATTTPLVHKQLVNHLKAMAKAVGWDTAGISGHSLRRGAATNAQRLDVPNVTEQVAMLGDWTSRSVHLYHEVDPASRLRLPRAIAADMRRPLA